MRKSKTHDKRLSVAKTMPPLSRKLPGKDYSVKNDMVIAWVKANPALLDYLVDRLRGIGYIVYNKETGNWEGVDYVD